MGMGSGVHGGCAGVHGGVRGGAWWGRAGGHAGAHGGGVQCQNSAGSRLLSPRGSSARRGTGPGPWELLAGVQQPVDLLEEEEGGERLW